MNGGRFDVEFEDKWFTSVAPGTNLVYEDLNIANILTKIESVEDKIVTKVDNVFNQLKSYMGRG